MGIGAPVSLSGFESRLGSRVHKSLGLRCVVFLNPLEKHQIDWSWRRVSTMSGLGAQLLYNLASLANTIIWESGLPVFAKRMQPEAPNLADPQLQEHSIRSKVLPAKTREWGPTPKYWWTVDAAFKDTLREWNPKAKPSWILDLSFSVLHQPCCGFGICSCPLFLSCSSPSRPPKNFVCQSSNYEQNWNQHPRPGGP